MRKFFLFLFGVFLFPSVAMAQDVVPIGSVEDAVVVADINISDATIVSRDADSLVVGFDVVNRGDVPQGDIRYGLEILRTKADGRAIVDSAIAAETLSIAAKASEHREVSYRIPTFLDGDYDIWAVSRTGSGMMLGLAKAGTVSLTATEGSVVIDNASCRLVIEGVDGTYALRQGVDIASGEALTLVCTVENRWQNPVAVTPHFETYRRSLYGPTVGLPASTQSVSLGAGERGEVRIAVPTASEAQSFDFEMAFRNAAGRTVSNSVSAHYVVQGQSGTLQNVSIDKASYGKGEVMTVSGFWAGSADGFPNSRGGRTELSQVSVSVSVTDAAGRPCSEPFSTDVSAQESEFALTGKMLADCASPAVTVVLSSQGRELDRKVLGSVGESDATLIPTASGSVFGLNDILVRFVLVLFLISVILILWRLRGKQGARVLLFLAVASSGAFLFADRASALTWQVPRRNPLAIFTVNADRETYEAGSSIDLSGTAEYYSCANGWGGYYVDASLEGETVRLGEDLDFSGAGYDEDLWLPDYLEGSLAAPSVPGEYVITLKGVHVDFAEDGEVIGAVSSTVRMPVTVVIPNRAPTDPTIGGPTSGLTGTDYEFTAVATDPDGDAVRYGFDWDGDDTVDQWMPSTGFTESGTAQGVSHSWGTEGTMTFRALTEDENGTTSGWVGHSIALSVPPSYLTLCIQGSDADPYTIAKSSGALQLSAHYGTDGDCSDPDVTDESVFADENPTGGAVSVSGTTLAGEASGSEKVTATYDGNRDEVLVNVTAPCTYDCQVDQHCQGEDYVVTDSCGRPHDCSGTRSCDFNWKETAPGE